MLHTLGNLYALGIPFASAFYVLLPFPYALRILPPPGLLHANAYFVSVDTTSELMNTTTGKSIDGILQFHQTPLSAGFATFWCDETPKAEQGR